MKSERRRVIEWVYEHARERSVTTTEIAEGLGGVSGSISSHLHYWYQTFPGMLTRVQTKQGRYNGTAYLYRFVGKTLPDYRPPTNERMATEQRISSMTEAAARLGAVRLTVTRHDALDTSRDS